MNRAPLRLVSLTASLLLSLSLLTGGCGDDELVGFEAPPEPPLLPDIVSRPDIHDFGVLRVGEGGSVQIRVGNRGEGLLEVSSVTVTGDGAAAYLVTDDPVSAHAFAQNELADLTLEFRPAEARRYLAVLEIASNDPDENPLKIPLDGTGVVIDDPIAVCNVIPGTVHVGEGASFTGEGSHDPNGTAIVGYSWQLTARPQDSTLLLPGCASTMECGPFVPDAVGLYEATLTVTSASGLTGSCTATLEAIPPPEGPVAVCSVTPDTVAPPFASATWIGNASHDPDGRPLTYSWRIQSAPAGSAVNLSANCAGAPDCPGFTPDQAGPYVGELTVTNDAGLSDTCTATLLAEPAEALWVAMHWTFPGDDMDLHLIAPGGTPRSEGDCYFANCEISDGPGPDWGTQNLIDDDPALELDDIDGTGPENINIASPAPGQYKVMVHDYPGSLYPGANNVTVEVRLDGRLVYTDTRTISNEDSETDFCLIDWPSGVVTRL
ncbi:MAG: choice-of-anchor D domain-containing protein [Deltaproteobacteria bacterium]|nr:choice-of-anchor D domain-containing protein [Deltaproteobacteria bacterium]